METEINFHLLSNRLLSLGLWVDVTLRKSWPTAQGASMGAVLASDRWPRRDNTVLHFAACVAALPLPLHLPVAVGQAKMPCQNFRCSLGGGTSPRWVVVAELCVYEPHKIIQLCLFSVGSFFVSLMVFIYLFLLLSGIQKNIMVRDLHPSQSDNPTSLLPLWCRT